MMNSNNEDMFILSSQVDYNHQHRSSVGGLVGYNSNNQGPYYQEQQREGDHTNRMYFGEELLDENKSEPVQDAGIYGNSYMFILKFMQKTHLHDRQ
jgi:hypothetical protein